MTTHIEVLGLGAVSKKMVTHRIRKYDAYVGRDWEETLTDTEEIRLL